MYPHTEIEIVDNSQYKRITVAEPGANTPVAMSAFLSDRGTEEVGMYRGAGFFNMFGANTDIERYGQAFFQACQVIQKGGRVYAKRIVAPDAQIANTVVYVHVLRTGNAQDGYKATLKYNSVSVVSTSNDLERVAAAAEAALPLSATDGSDTVLPLYLITPMGRGSYAPRFRMTPDYRYSRTAGFAKYIFEVVNPSNYQITEETFTFSANPNAIEKNLNMGLDMAVERGSNQIRVLTWNDNLLLIPAMLEAITGATRGSLAAQDFLFGRTVQGVPIDKVTVDFTSFNPQDVFGNELLNGSDGSFAVNATSTSAYSQQLVNFFNGTFSDDIYNLDSLSIDFILDANYPAPVKRAIEEFVTWRQDCYYIRDMGLNIYSVDDVFQFETSVLHNMFSGSYCNSMMVIDDTTRRYVHVTIPYIIAGLITIHFINGCNRPFAGIRYGITWSYGAEIKRGSINFVPKVTPNIDEKTQLDDLGVNYVSIYNGNTVVMETFYTGQHYNASTQFDYVQNVWNVQRVVKALRLQCPKSRYAFLRGQDFTDYQNDVNSAASQYSDSFMSFSMTYAADPDYEANNIYYALLEVSFVSVAQAEKFKITAIAA